MPSEIMHLKLKVDRLHEVALERGALEFEIGLALRDLDASPKQFKAICAEVGLTTAYGKKLLKKVLPKPEPKPKKKDKPAAAEVPPVTEAEADVHHVKQQEVARITRIREIITAWHKNEQKASFTTGDDRDYASEALIEIEKLVQ